MDSTISTSIRQLSFAPAAHAGQSRARVVQTAADGPVDAQADSTKTLAVLVRSVTHQAEAVRSFELVDPERRPLPAFTAGSHIDVSVPGGHLRQYSLCNDPSETGRYVIAVLRDGNSRGGSVAMHDRISPGSLLTISRPRNRFALVRTASRHVLLAGGIGITPFMSMIADLGARGERFHLHYCTRTRQRTAFIDELEPLIAAGQVTLHHDAGDPARGLDFEGLLAACEPGAHLYYCGPAGFMTGVENACARWPCEAVHYERFNAPPPRAAAEDSGPSEAFTIRLARTGETFDVPAGKSIVEVLRENGVEVDTSCEDGYCGTCMTRYTEGRPIHHDSVLDEQDRREFVMICCARSKSPCLVLDL